MKKRTYARALAFPLVLLPLTVGCSIPLTQRSPEIIRHCPADEGTVDEHNSDSGCPPLD